MVAARLDGKVAMVTGGSSGIGRAAALAFARAGAKVAIADLAVPAGEAVVEAIRSDGGEATFIPTDVSNASEVRALVQKVALSYGSLDCALNNAGITGDRASTVACSESNWDRVMAINLKGVWLCMKYAIPYMREQGQGVIVNMASVNGLNGGTPGFSAYAASKHAVIGLTKAAATEYARAGVRINAICPGYIQTPMIESYAQNNRADFDRWLETFVPAKRLGTPAEIAEAVLWLCSDAASFMTGHAMVVDGGLMAR